MNDYFLFTRGRRYDGLSELSWEQNDEFSTVIEFKLREKLDTGTKFSLINGNNLVLRGIITDVDYDRQKIYHYAGYDFGFYLNKNEVVYHALGQSIQIELSGLLGSVNIPIGNLAGIGGNIKRIYFKKTVADVVKDMLDESYKQTGQRYFVDCQNGSFNLVAPFMIPDLKGELDEKAYIISTDHIGNAKIKTSIQDLKNRVAIYAGNEENHTYKVAAQSTGSIANFGVLH